MGAWVRSLRQRMVAMRRGGLPVAKPPLWQVTQALVTSVWSKRAGVHELKIGPAAVAETFDEARFSHQLQVTRDARLALAQNAREILHTQLAAGQQRKQPHPGRLGDRAQHRQCGSLIKHGLPPGEAS